MRVGGFIDKLKAFNEQASAEAAFTDTSESYANLNAEQMYSGMDSQDEDITLDGGGYAPITIRIKKEKGQPTDRVTLKDTGAFYRGLYAKMDGANIYTGSTDPKTEEIEARTGKDIFGLNEGNKKAFALGPFLRAFMARFIDTIK